MMTSGEAQRFSKKYVDMTERWARLDQGQTETEPEPDGEFPPKRWCRDEYVEQVMGARFGLRFSEYRQLLKKSMRKEITPDYPIHLDFDLRDACNLACTNCSENFRDWTKATFNLDWIKKDPFFAKKKLFAANVGNAAEPFLMPEAALELIRFLRANDIIDIFIHTNGILLDEPLIDQLIENDVTWVSVSIDAATEETFSKVRGKGFDKVIRNIQLIRARREALGKKLPFLRVSFFVMPENRHEVKAFHDFWRPSVEMIEFQNFWSPNPPGVETKPHIDSNPLFEQISDAECSQPFYRMGVSASGIVGPCCSSYGHFDELRLGTVLGTESVVDMWRSAKMQRIRSEHLKPNGPHGLKICSQCLRQNYKFKYFAKDISIE